MTSAATSSLPIDQSKLVPGHPEAWAPLLLQSLITHGVTNISTQPEAVYLPWARARRLSIGDYGPLLGAGSWNHQIMIESCLVWMGDADAIEWMCTLLEYQLGIRQPESQALDILSYIGGTETLSVEYEGFRLGSYAAVALLAKRFSDHPQSKRVTSLVSKYFSAIASLLYPMSTSWRDESQFKGAAGPWYAGLMISPVGERSAVGHFQNDLGPFVSYLHGLSFTSKREDWPMQIIRELALSLTPPVSPLSATFQTTSIHLWAPIHWQVYADGSVVVWKDSRQNGNTSCVMWSIADTSTRTMTLGYPWSDGRQGARHSDGSGSCTIEGGRIVARNNDIVSVGTLPTSQVVSRWHADNTGISKEV